MEDNDKEKMDIIYCGPAESLNPIMGQLKSTEIEPIKEKSVASQSIIALPHNYTDPAEFLKEYYPGNEEYYPENYCPECTGLKEYYQCSVCTCTDLMYCPKCDYGKFRLDIIESEDNIRLRLVPYCYDQYAGRKIKFSIINDQLPSKCDKCASMNRHQRRRAAKLIKKKRYNDIHYENEHKRYNSKGEELS